MFGLSRLISLLIVFSMGFGLAAGLFVGIPAAVVASYSLRDLENTNLVNIPDEKFLLPDAPVDILDLNGIELYKEIKELQTFGDDLTLNLLKSRYGILFHEKLSLLMTDEAMNMPLKQLFSMDGVHAVLKNVFIGNVEGFECMNGDGTPDGDPHAEDSYWVNKEGKQISALEEIIADFTLDDFISGNINTDSILHGDITLADILGYHYDEERACWVDGRGEKVVGIMAVFADCTLDDVDNKINTAQIGELLSYTKGEDDKWYETDEEGNQKEVHSFMAAVAEESIGTLGGLFERITIGQIVPAEQRENGLMSIIPPDTTIDQIGGAVNKSVSNSPLQFFINQGLIDFNIELTAGMTVAQFMDARSNPDTNATNKIDPNTGLPMFDPVTGQPIMESKNYMVTFKHVDPGEEGYEDFCKNQDYYGSFWISDENGNYKVPAWRTKQLSQSFAYIIAVMTGGAAEESDEPVIKLDYQTSSGDSE